MLHGFGRSQDGDELRREGRDGVGRLIVEPAAGHAGGVGAIALAVARAGQVPRGVQALELANH